MARVYNSAASSFSRPPRKAGAGTPKTFAFVVFNHYVPQWVRLGGALRKKLGEPER